MSVDVNEMHDLNSRTGSSYRDFEGLFDEEAVTWIRTRAVELGNMFRIDEVALDVHKRLCDVLANLIAETVSEAGFEEAVKVDWENVAWAVNEVLTTRYWSRKSGIEYDDPATSTDDSTE